MRYPKFLDNNSVIGVCAPSMGVGRKIENYEKSLKNIEEYFKVIESDSVRKDGLASNSATVRAEEFNELIKNKDVDMIWCASGGEILIDMLPYVDIDSMDKNIKWVQGYSDPTTLLYLITTKLDVATIYGVNAGGFDQDKLHKSLEYNFELLKGNIEIQNSFDKYESIRGNGEYNLDKKVKWISNKDNIDLSGRLIGGCIECLNDIIGSYFDYTNDFVNRYSKDGIIWYFDIFDMSSIQLYRTLFHMKYTGWFENAKCFIFSRVLFKNEELVSYYEAVEMILGDIPFVMDADIGHVNPKMTLINGSIANIKYENGMGSIELFLE